MQDRKLNISHSKFENAVIPLVTGQIEVLVCYDINSYDAEYETALGWEVCIPIEGCFGYETLIRSSASTILEVSPGQALLICPHSQTRLLAMPVKYLHIHLRLGRLSITLRDHGNTASYHVECHESSRAHQSISQNLSEVAELLRKRSKFLHHKADLLFRLSIVEVIEGSRTDHSDGSDPSRARRAFSRFNEFISSHFREAKDSAEFAGEFGMSPQNLNKLVHKMRGMSLNHFISLLRLEHARSQMQKYPVAELASRSGFSNTSYFIQLFKKMYGTTPLQLAKRLSSPSDEESAVELHMTDGFKLLASGIKKPVLKPATMENYRTMIVANQSSCRKNLLWLPKDQPPVVIRSIPPGERVLLGTAEGEVWSIQPSEQVCYYTACDQHVLIVVE